MDVESRPYRWFQTALGDVLHAGWSIAQHWGQIGPMHRRARRFAAFGDRSLISFPPTVIYGEQRIEIGAYTTIGPNATLSVGMPAQADLDGDPVISIGDRCTLGKGIGIVAHERVVLEDDIWTGHFVYITDQNHGYEDVDQPVGTQLWKNEPVRIGAGSWLGHGSVVLPGVTIGRHVVVAAGAVVTANVPDRCVIGGVPAKIVRRHVDGVGWVKTQADGTPILDDGDLRTPGDPASA